jgi:GntR family transcriptional regulator
MLIVLDPHSGIPVYRQLMDQIKFHIASGLVKPGDELPSTRALSAELGLNPMTVSKAYGYLEREGVLERRPGLPLVVSSGGDELQAARQEQIRRSLGPAALVARQLRIPPDEALRIFHDLLKEDHDGFEHPNGAPTGDPDPESGS